MNSVLDGSWSKASLLPTFIAFTFHSQLLLPLFLLCCIHTYLCAMLHFSNSTIILCIGTLLLQTKKNKYCFFYGLMYFPSGFPKWRCGKELLANAGEVTDMDLIPGWEDLLEEEMANYSSIPAWKSPQTEEPGRLPSMGLQSQTRLRD